jgi:ribose 5-phosphate isomerase B
MTTYRIAVGGDHAGYPIKKEVITYLKNKGYIIKDFGAFSDESVDYPDFAHQVATAVENGEFDLGFLFCGSGNGVNITANKHNGIRAALCWIPEIASLARQHNNANICAIPARYVTATDAVSIVDAFLAAKFEGGRHMARVTKI